MLQVREYLDRNGRSPHSDWFDDLYAPAAAKLALAVFRMEQGNLSNAKSVGAGVYEYRIEFGPGYRIYFGSDGDRLVILLGRGEARSIVQAINRQIAHCAYHCGQIVLLAKHFQHAQWASLTIPKGGESAEFNANVRAGKVSQR